MLISCLSYWDLVITINNYYFLATWLFFFVETILARIYLVFAGHLSKAIQWRHKSGAVHEIARNSRFFFQNPVPGNNKENIANPYNRYLWEYT